MADSEAAPTATGERVFSKAFGTIALVFALAVAGSTGVLVLIDNSSDSGCGGGGYGYGYGGYGGYCPPPGSTSTTTEGEGEGQGPNPNGPAKFGLCRAYFAGRGGVHGNKLNAPPFRRLAEAAAGFPGATEAERVAAFCAGVQPGNGQGGGDDEQGVEPDVQRGGPNNPNAHGANGAGNTTGSGGTSVSGGSGGSSGGGGTGGSSTESTQGSTSTSTTTTLLPPLLGPLITLPTLF